MERVCVNYYTSLQRLLSSVQASEWVDLLSGLLVCAVGCRLCRARSLHPADRRQCAIDTKAASKTSTNAITSAVARLSTVLLTGPGAAGPALCTRRLYCAAYVLAVSKCNQRAHVELTKTVLAWCDFAAQVGGGACLVRKCGA